MSHNVKKEREAHSVNLQDIAERGTPKEDILLRIEDNRRLVQQERVVFQQRLLARRLKVLALLVLIGFSSFFAYRYYTRPPQIVIPQGQLPVPAPDTISVTVGDPSTLDNYVLKKAVVNLPATGVFDVYAFDFDRHTFLKGKTVLTEQSVLKQTLDGLLTDTNLQRVDGDLQKKLPDSWAFIFAGASFEGYERDNIQLCRERVKAVACMLKSASIANLGYWRLAAGEFKSGESGKPSLSDKEENRLAGELKEEGLIPQRRLLVLFVAPRTAPPQAAAVTSTVTALTGLFYDHKLLPTDYKLERPKPTFINKTAVMCEAPPN